MSEIKITLPYFISYKKFNEIQEHLYEYFGDISKNAIEGKRIQK